MFPTERTRAFFRLLHSSRGGCRGQTIHQIIRDPGVLHKQLLYGLCRKVFDNITARHVLEEWRSHSTVFPYRARDIEETAEYLDIWADALGRTIRAAVSEPIEELLRRYVPVHEYELYLDWLVTVGVVPLIRLRDTTARERDRAQDLRAVAPGKTDVSSLAGRSAIEAIRVLDETIRVLSSIRIPNTGNVIIRRHRRDERIRAFHGDEEIPVYIYTRPLAYEDGELIYTTPLAHLYTECLRHAALRRHEKVCQLLNTFPVKAITTSRHEMAGKRIVELMERRDRNSDAKKSIIRFLLNLSDSKSKIGIEDSVESFIQDLTPSIVDQSKLLPQRGPPAAPGPAAETSDRDVRELFKKQVIRCMEEQIESQMEEIQGLKLLNQAWEKKAEELKAALSRHGVTVSESESYRQDDLDSLPIFDAIRRVQSLPFDTLSVDDNTLVANSFLSQFIPDSGRSEQRLDALWESEYTRTFRLRREFTNQGTELDLAYSNYTVNRVLTPFLSTVLGLFHVEPVPEEHLNLSPSSLVEAAYRDSRAGRYVDFVCSRELARARVDFQTSEEPHGGRRVRPDPTHPSRYLPARATWHERPDWPTRDPDRNVQHPSYERSARGQSRS